MPNQNTEPKSPLERIQKNIDKKIDGCWLWNGAIDAHGYGALSFQGKLKKAHRFSFENYVGRIPLGIHVLHKCDVRNCVNPDHLFLGTNQANIKDMIEKKRNAFGIKNHSAKLKDEDIPVIKRLSPNFSHSEIADIFGVTRQTIGAVINERTWRHV